jgi:glycosyltransferase involved in cell wall biosynthesis
MRVCMLVRNAFVRDARVLREAQTLAEAGHDVDVVATMEPGLPAREERDGFRVRRIEPVPRWMTRVVGRPVIATQTTPARSKPRRRPAALVGLRDRIVSARFGAVAASIDAQVFHAHDLNTLQAAHTAARYRNAWLVYDAHELYPELAGFSAAERKLWSAVEARLIGDADRVVTVSEGIAEELARRYGIEPPVVLLNCPTRPASPPDPARSPLSSIRGPGEMLVLYAGAMEPNRGLEALVEAASGARGWRLVMMGWGSLESSLHAPGVEFVAPVSPHEIVGAAAGADVGVIPYLPAGLNNTLSFPNKLFDYVHAGLAIAASDLPQIRRFIEREGAGVVFHPGDAAGIRAMLDELAADAPQLERMKSAAREASSRYDWTVERIKLIRLYADFPANA